MGIADRKNLIIASCVVIFCIAMGVIFSLDTDEQPANTTSDKVEQRNKNKSNVRKTRPPLRRTQAKRNKRNITETNIRAENRPKPNMFALEDAEEKELTELARKVLASLQSALDSESYDQILKIIDMVNNAPKGSLSKTMAGMPVALRKRLVEALGWFGARAIPELAGFLADADPEVFQMTLDQFEQALSDVSLGDRDRAKIVKLATSILKDRDALEQMIMEIANMRNSVTGQSIYDVFTDGTPEAKEVLQENLEFLTGEDNIQTVDDLQKWINEHPDDPDDDDLYGPMDTGETQASN